MTGAFNDLIARLEAATGPDPHLDAEIEAALRGGIPEYRCRWKLAGQPSAVRSADAAGATWYSAPSFTGSLDAALTLVPEGFDYGFSYSKKDGLETWVQRPFREGTCHQGYAPEGINDDSTRALALCIAALRARASLPPRAAGAG